MAGLKIDRVTRQFSDFKALKEVSLDVADGEFLAVLGPSGCGKTTLLRLIAGFDKVTGGAIWLDDRLLSDTRSHVATEDRGVGIVFQSYALWPHMTVAENVAYGLEVAGLGRAQRDKRVNEALELVGLTQYGGRMPAMLSGGQRQRVALARCLVMEPGLVLLDEPLANLDVHLRASMEEEFRRFHERTGTTMVYITHDQAEAMALADRIAVLDRGVLEQVASASTLYREPATEMVAGFVGQGIVVPAEMRGAGHGGTCAASVFGAPATLRCRPGMPARAGAKACLRSVDLAFAAPGEAGMSGTVRRLIYQGGFFRAEFHPDASPGTAFVLEVPEPAPIEAGARASVAVRGGWIIPEGERR
ncbi:MAG: ABC transporter ATP-binding protein [Rhodospirillales bacterium]|nr:ABC transporter ATP-binding protein [Rhodospirillales bacterium]